MIRRALILLLSFSSFSFAQSGSSGQRPTGPLVLEPYVSYRTITAVAPNGDIVAAQVRVLVYVYRDRNGAMQVYSEWETITPLRQGTWRDLGYRNDTVIPGRLPGGSQRTQNDRGRAEHFTPRPYYRP